MSINVNVTGNPICIKRGKMVVADPDFASKEFQKRRLIRLQQVRQQSKEFAEKIRNKVRSAKNKQLAAAEKEREEELKKWQARKLLTLQQQYRGCLKDIGLGHVQAALEDESDEMLLSEKESKEEFTRNRGVEALQKLRENVQKEKDNKLECAERRKYNKAVENARSTMVVSLHKTQSHRAFKKKKKEKPAININISNEMVSESESELDLQVPVNTERLSLSDSSIELARLSEKGTQANIIPICNQATGNDDIRTTRHYPLDTRISDRIKRRKLKCTNCAVADSFLDNKVETIHVDPQTSTNQELQASDRDLTVMEILKYNNEKFQRPIPNVQSKLPSKPTLTLRSTDVHQMPINSGNKVQYYDHRNLFAKEYEQTLSSVRKINEDSIEGCPSNGSEAEYVEQMYKRDRDAQIRGQKALEKVKVQQNYKEMMEQLPKLQKKERIASIACNKPEFHMSEDRLQEHERKRQNRMENAYEKLFPQVQMVTLAPIKKDEIGGKETKSKINVGSWNFDTQKPSTSTGARSTESKLLQQADNKLLGSDKKPQQGKEKLNKMLQSLTEQRNKLAGELKSLPETSQNLNEATGFSTWRLQTPVAGPSHTRDGPRSRGCCWGVVKKQIDHSSWRREDPKTYPKTSPQLSLRTKPETKSRELPNEKRSILKGNKSNSSSSSSLPPTNNVATIKNKDVKSTQSTPQIHQTISTQTTPVKLKKETVKVDAVTETSVIKENKVVTALAGKPSEKSRKCNCCPKAHTDTCEIVIKICDDGSHKISLSPQKHSQKNVERIDKNTVQFKTQKEKAKSAERKKSVSQGYWHEVLSHNSNNSSTSYYSPPDLSQSMSKKQPITKFTPSAPFRSMLRSNVQQHNVVNETSLSTPSTPGSNVKNEVLFGQIQRLLTMSCGSVDRLDVSAVSDVSTPNSSIINMESNNSKDTLENIMKHFNLNRSEIDRYLNYSADHSNVHYNSATNTLSSNSKVSPIATPSPHFQDVDKYAIDNYPGVLMAYNKMAENCAKKIENFASMIEQVRLEKLDILKHSPFNGSDKENSTKYLDLPAQQNRTVSPRCDSPEQEHLTRQLLEIDYGFAKQLTQKKAPERPQSPESSADLDTTGQELLTRFKQLKDSDAVAPHPGCLDITRLPKFEAKSTPCCVTSNKTFKSPLSRGITVAMRYNENVNVPPHELSAIPEVGSLVSNRQYQMHSPSSRPSRRERFIRESIEDVSRVTEISPALLGSISQDIFDNNRNASERHSKTAEENNSSSTSLPDILSEIGNAIQVLNTQKSTDNSKEICSQSTSVETLISQKSDSSTSEMENIEALLQHLGMGWAVATLRKTQEALALTSSSSSSIDLSLKESVNKRVLNPYLDTSRRNESSSGLSTFLPQQDDTSSSGNKTSRKTSTPVQVSAGAVKSTSNTQPNIIPTAESDLSSIRTSSNDFTYDFTQFYSLNEASSNQTKDN